MWPWGHLAVGYLLYSAGVRRRGRLPEFPEVLLVAVGTQFPDLVDKPLAWNLGLLESGRSLGHSVLVAAVVLAVLSVVLVPRVGRSPVVAFAVGYLSHPLADIPPELFAGEVAQVHYVVWPLLPLPPYDTELSLLEYLLTYRTGPYELLQLGLFVAAVVVWYLDGAPGLAEFRQRVTRATT